MFDVEPALVKGDGGVFEVRVDGRVLFSKNSMGGFPTPDEVLERISNEIRSGR